MKTASMKACLAHFDKALKQLRTELPAPCVIEHQLVADTKITWRYRGWSSALTWICIEGDVALDELSKCLRSRRRAPLPMPLGTPWADPIVGGGYSTQTQRHAAALAHGLSPGGGNDLPPARMLIDRQLRNMLEDTGIDLHEAIAKRLQNYWWERQYVKFHSKLYPVVGDRCFTITQSGLETPVLITTVAIGTAKYDGASLVLPGHLPDTICSGSAGRRLGELIKTGHAILERRSVSHVVNDEGYGAGYEPYPVTIISLDPDLIEIGAPERPPH